MREMNIYQHLRKPTILIVKFKVVVII